MCQRDRSHASEFAPASEPAVTRALSERSSRGFRGRRCPPILAIGPAVPEPAAAGDQVVIDLPAVEQRGLDAYRIEGLA